MEGLGKDFDVVAVADGVWLNLRDYEDVTFIGILSGGDTFTVQEATAQDGTGNQDLDVIDHWYAQVDGDGTDSWTLEAQTPADAAVTEADDVVAVHVSAAMLSPGFGYIKCTATSTGVVIAILHGLKVRRDPANLPAVSV
jgi:hypothetical protein